MSCCRDKVRCIHSPSLERAVSAAHKRVQLLPGCPTAQLQYALLLYFQGRWAGGVRGGVPCDCCCRV